MNAKNISTAPESDYGLTPFIEPLANYISATERPRQVLLSALAALFDELEGTHKATLMHLASSRADSLRLAL